jgi:preprotein translocase subunit SecE
MKASTELNKIFKRRATGTVGIIVLVIVIILILAFFGFLGLHQ